ncbi:MAG: DNA polymerase III subunit delta' [Desulfovibrio sp.]|nr:DNA polymerase III subunit delta' [Desulfovibrio sp.]
MSAILEAIAGTPFAHVRDRLDSLGAAPPQVLLLEGGTEAQRLDAALYWACRANCPDAERDGSPCLNCPTCRQMAAWENLDLSAYDGRISNTQDQTEPGPIRALTIENVRELKSKLKDPPHARFRVTLLMGIENKRVEAANALLKALEEPSKNNLFVLLCPQRQQLLPTLVSRSLCLTLPWPDPEAVAPELLELQTEIAQFLETGREFFNKTGSKSFDQGQAFSAVMAVHKSLIRTLAGTAGGSPLDQTLARLSPGGLMQLGRWIGEANQALQAQVTPARVTEAFLANVYVLLHSGQ